MQFEICNTHLLQILAAVYQPLLVFIGANQVGITDFVKFVTLIHALSGTMAVKFVFVLAD